MREEKLVYESQLLEIHIATLRKFIYALIFRVIARSYALFIGPDRGKQPCSFFFFFSAKTYRRRRVLFASRLCYPLSSRSNRSTRKTLMPIGGFRAEYNLVIVKI